MKADKLKMGLEVQIISGVMSYPTLFPNRARVLDHLFVTLGNGYDWESGVLVGWGENTPPLNARTPRIRRWLYDMQTVSIASSVRNLQSIRGRFRDSFEQAAIEAGDGQRALFLLKSRMDLDEPPYPSFEEAVVLASTWPDKSSFHSTYPVCDMVKSIIPDDIRDDYLEGLIEYLFWLIHVYEPEEFTTKGSNFPNVATTRVHRWAENKPGFETWLGELKERFGARVLNTIKRCEAYPPWDRK